MSDKRKSHAIPETIPFRQPQSLNREDIRYLVLEGGGGKGFAYLGALQVLEKLGIMSQIKGFGGASAGAITALLLSIGMGSKDIENFLNNTDFTAFFDKPRPRLKPIAGTVYSAIENSKLENEFLSNPTFGNFYELFPKGDAQGLISNAGAGLDVLKALFPSLLLLLSPVEYKIKTETLDFIKKKLFEHKPIGQILWDGSKYYLAYLARDMGLFSGQAARDLFNELLLEHYLKKQKYRTLRAAVNTVTFAQHYNTFRKKLLLTGTNLRTGKTVLFSKDDTPDFPVADAVRISMGLPLVYKPYVITDSHSQWPPCGIYVDGGVWNNLPYREFDTEAQEDARKARKPFTPATLGLRLEIEPPVTINSAADIVLAMLSKGLFGSGESQVLDKYSAQAILLDTRGLDLLNFSPDLDKRKIVNKRSRRQTLRYFGLDFEITDEDRDEEDDFESYCLNKAAESCSSASFKECKKAAGLIDTLPNSKFEKDKESRKKL